MDFLTQQFIAFARRVRIQVTRLEGLIKQQNETIERAAHTQQRQPQPTPEIHAELHLPKAISDAAAKYESPSKWLPRVSTVANIITAIATVGAFAAAAIYAHYAHQTLIDSPRPL